MGGTVRLDDAEARRLSPLFAVGSPVPVDQVVTWGLSDKYSWLKALWRDRYGDTVRQPRPLLYDEYMQKKAAWTAVSNALRSRRKR